MRRLLLLCLALPLAGGAELPLLGAAECLASPTCMTYSYSDPGRAVLGRESKPVMAHFVAGQARTFSRQHVYESLRKKVIEALPSAGHDVFICVSKGANSAEIEQRPLEAWLAVFAGVGNVVGFSLIEDVEKPGEPGQRAKINACYAMFAATEAAAGKQYKQVFRHRPDTFYHAPVHASLADVGSVSLYKYDIAGVCPRAAVTAEWPCDVPNDSGRGDPKLRPTEAFSVSFERMGGGDTPYNHVTENERHFEWAWWFTNDLKAYATDGGTSDDHLLNAGMNFLASLCFSYDVQRVGYLFNEVPLRDEYAETGWDNKVDAPGPTCHGEALVAQGYTRFYTGVHDRAGAYTAALTDFEKLVGFGGGHWRQRANDVPFGTIPFLETLCGCRWQVCGLGNHSGVPAEAAAFTRELCSRSFTTPLTSRRYMYRPPALNPHFGKADFEETFRVSHLARIEEGVGR